MKKTRKLNSHRDLDIKKGSVDNKLTAAAIHLECIFDRGVNFKDRIITLTEEVDFPMFDIVDAALTEMENESRKTVTIRIHSGGGSVYEALAIVGRLKKSKCKIVTEGYGHTMSAATLILACGNVRKFSRFGWFMHHESQYFIEGKHSDHKDYVAQAEREEKQWAKFMAEFSKKSEKFWLTEGSRKDAYFDAGQLLKLGVIDEII